MICFLCRNSKINGAIAGKLTAQKEKKMYEMITCAKISWLKVIYVVLGVNLLSKIRYLLIYLYYNNALRIS